MLATETLDAAVQRLVRCFRPEKIILFGSYATGQPREDSDVDLLVVAETDQSADDPFAAGSRALADFPAAFDLIVRTPEEYRRRRGVVNDIVYFAEKYGRVVYER